MPFSRDWKHRSDSWKGNKYGLRIHRNYLNSRYDPVFWLLSYLAYTKITSGAIFPVSERAWTDSSLRLFEGVSFT